MDEVISPNQSAFIRGRQSIDGLLVANICIDVVIKRGESGIICNLDLEKAYDRVNWQFLDYMLNRLGLGFVGGSGCRNIMGQLHFRFF